MNEIKFSNDYLKFWGQKTAELIAVRDILIDENPNWKLLEYDTKTTEGKYYKLPKGKYLQLIFVGNDNIPFCTLRRSTVEKEKYYRAQIGRIFEIVIPKIDIEKIDKDFDDLVKEISEPNFTDKILKGRGR